MKIDLNNKKSRKFLAIVKNTINDLKQNSSYDKEVVEGLNDILKTKTINLLSSHYIYQIIEARQKNIDYIESIQDRQSFNIVNEEHRYMLGFLSQYFESDLEIKPTSSGDRLSGSIKFIRL